MKIINKLLNRIECIRTRIPYKIKGKWYNESLHIPHQHIQINLFRHNGTYIQPRIGNIVPVIIIERERRVYARYTITKITHLSIERKPVYTDDDVFYNLTFHSTMYII